jgi:SPP1 gp7 family putative phage head morphogenesis protein
MSIDPTETTTLRNEHEAEYYKRLRALKGDLRSAIAENDVLYLGTQRARNAEPKPRDYQFLTDERKRERFQAWLQTQIENDILVVENVEGARSGSHFSAQYLRKAYAKGVRDANRNLRAQGYDIDTQTMQDVFNQRVHQEAVEQLYVRAYENLADITADMSDEIGEELADAFTQGWNPRTAASNINDRVDTIGITRSRLLARTEIIHAHAEGTLDRLESEGFETVTPDVEFQTAGDTRVCPICRSLDGNVYTIQEARGIVPRHPSCRCALIPRPDANR